MLKRTINDVKPKKYVGKQPVCPWCGTTDIGLKSYTVQEKISMAKLSGKEFITERI